MAKCKGENGLWCYLASAGSLDEFLEKTRDWLAGFLASLLFLPSFVGLFLNGSKQTHCMKTP